MTAAGSVDGGERIRLFLALILPEHAVERLAAWQARELDGRAVARSNLHVTLAFLGSRPRQELEAIERELDEAATHARRPVLAPVGYRETRNVGMIVLADHGGAASAFAAALHARLGRLGVYRPEQRAWLPHVTVLRFRKRPRLTPPPPELGEVVPSEAAVFLSVLRPSGAQYQVLHSVALGG